MLRRSLALLATVGMLGTAGAAAREEPRTTAPSAAPSGIRLAQLCGWFAIYSCSRYRDEAYRFANGYRGFVVDSGHELLPNFRPGWYCVVDGPTSRDQAMALAAYARGDGHRTAYAKSSC